MLKLIHTSEKVKMRKKEKDLNSKYVNRNISIWIQILEKLGLDTIDLDYRKNGHV